VGQGLEWAQGYGPYTHEKTYDYATGERVRDEQLCPLAFGLSAVPSSGLAPFSTTIQWTGDLNDPGKKRCQLDLGDGTPPVDIEPCPASGEYEHIYNVPSEMRETSGLYTVTFTRIGAAQTATTDVQARFRFDADPASGKAPLSTLFSWAGFDLVTKKLSCTLDFGDGSATVVVEDRAKKPGVSHDYAQAGVYTAKLTVRGEDRPVSKTLTIEVTQADEQPASDCAYLRDVTSWRASASFSYSVSASDSDLSITHTAGGTMEGLLTVSTQGPGGISFSDTSPSGTVSLSELEIKPAPYQDNPWYEFEGSNNPLPKLNSDDSGSNILLDFDLDGCRYNVHVQAFVGGTATQGKGSSPAQSRVASFQSEWLPLPDATSLSGGGPYPGHTETWILTTPELSRWYWIMNTDLEQMVSEDGFGNAQVSWQFEAVQ
jgi:PKD repeat protein